MTFLPESFTGLQHKSSVSHSFQLFAERWGTELFYFVQIQLCLAASATAVRLPATATSLAATGTVSLSAACDVRLSATAVRLGNVAMCYMTRAGMRAARTVSASAHAVSTAAAGADSRSAICIGAIGRHAAAAVIAPAAFADEAMAAPAVPIAPAGPWAHAQEDAVIEISRTVKAIRRAGVRLVVVVAIGTDGLNAYADHKLRLGRWRQCQAGEQCCCSEENFESAHM